MKGVSATVLLVLLAGAAHAEDAVKAGKWEFAAQVQVPNLPKLPPGVQLPPGVNIGAGGINVTRTRCVDSATPMPADLRPPTQQHGRCKVDDIKRSGGTVTWSTTCTQQDGSTVHSEGVAHYTGDTMEANMKTHVGSGPNGGSDSTQHITGRYLGACDGK